MPAPSYWPLPTVITTRPGLAPALGEDDFKLSLQNYLPRGRIWSRDPDSTLSKLLAGFGKAWARIHASALGLLFDAFPANTIELLPDWQASLGLPDPCAATPQSDSAARAQVMARLQNQGGQSISYFIAYALTLGYPITITEFSPSIFGRSFGMPFGGTAWAFAWQVNAPTFTVRPFFFSDEFGGFFSSWDNSTLQCELQRFSPGHTVLLFAYS